MDKHLVAVYGTLLTGQPNHRWMEDAEGKFISATFLDEPCHMVSLGAFPAISLKNPSPEGVSCPRVELWEVDDDGLTHLDNLEGYPNFYNRTLVGVDGKEAWVYHLERRDVYNAPPILHGSWVKYIEERTGLQMTEELIGAD